jgi:hypothetical protein
MNTKKTVIGALVVLLSAAAISMAKPDQPYMEAARDSLQKAKDELQAADRDKAGHRANAVKLTNKAISEVNAGIEYARRHNHAVTLDPKMIFGAQPDQPHMQAALDFLRSARSNLDTAVQDKGGHRANAIQYVDEAISEVKLGIDAGR